MLTTTLCALTAIAPIALIGWLYSVKKHNVNIVDSLWSMMFLAAATTYLLYNPEISTRNLVIYGLVALWALRLAGHLTMRNWNHAEDHRYQKIRQNNEPNFAFKSIYIVFGLQAVLAWLISMPLFFSLNIASSFHWLDMVALPLFMVGFLFQSVADFQLHRFRSNPANQGKVLNTGLWRYSRHPNYFGEFTMWWAFYLMALPTGGWWTAFGPVIISFLLLKVSGVVMMEKNITERKPNYQAYIDSTHAFFPWFAKNNARTSEDSSCQD